MMADALQPVSLFRLRKARANAAALLVRDGGEGLVMIFERLDAEVQAAEKASSAFERARALLNPATIPVTNPATFS